MDEGDRKILEDIERFGCSVMHVSAEGDLAPFSYSVGITKSSGAPEVVVIGLKQPIAHFIVNEYNQRVREGEQFLPGHRYSGFIEGFEVLAVPVGHEHYREHFGYDLWLYKGSSFEVLQLVYPNTSGVWPWQEEADEWFRRWQPLLGPAEDRSSEP
jgi:hypothetical protein